MVDLKFGAEVKFAVHEPGEEFWLHLDYAIGDPLHINIYDTSTDMSDSRITKEIRVRVSGCADWTSADYYSERLTCRVFYLAKSLAMLQVALERSTGGTG